MTMMTCILQDLATTTTTTTEDPTFNEEFGHHMAGAMMIMIGHTTIIDITKVDRVIHQENGPDIAMHEIDSHARIRCNLYDSRT